MKTLLRFSLLAAFNLLLLAPAIAQQDTGVAAKQADSLQNALLQEQNRKLQELQEARRLDSLKKQELENQLNSLQSTDNLKKQELLDELNDLKSRDSLHLLQQKKRIDSLRQFVTGYPVIPFSLDTLFNVYARLGSFSPRERAEAIGNRIHQLGKQFIFNPDTLRIVASEQTVDIVYGENIIMSVSENDALWENNEINALATVYRNKIVTSVNAYKDATSWKTLLEEFALAALVITLVFGIIYFMGKLFRWTRFKILSQKNKRLKGLKIGNYELFDAKRQVSFFLFLNNILKWVLIISIIYLALPALFSIFPWTKNFAETLLGYFLDPFKKMMLAIWHYLPKLFTIIVIVIVFRYVLKGIHFLKHEVETGALVIPGFYADWANPTYQILRVLILAFMLILIFPYLPGFGSRVFQGVSVFLGILFTFSSASSLSNITAGLVLTYMRAFKIGDRVKIGDVSGDIIEKSLLVTRIRTIKNEVISIPNSTVLNSHTTNYSEEPDRGLILYTTITIGYDAPWRQVHQLLIDAANATDMIEQKPEPFVLQTSLDDYYVSYQINAYTKEPNKQAVIYSQLHQHIQDNFNKAGIEIMSPHYRAMRDGNQTTIPAEHLPKDYEAPAFKIKQE